MGKKIGLIATILIAAFLSVFISFRANNTMGKFLWLPTESAPVNHPMQIVAGDLVFADGTSIYIPDKKDVNNGWGEGFSTHIVGDDEKSILTQLRLKWFSYTEDHFFGGQFPLPSDRIEKLFSSGFDHPVSGEKVTYDRIVVGMAPAGNISVWLSGVGVTTEVATFVAPTIEGDWKTILDNQSFSREQYIALVLDDVLSPEQREVNLEYDNLESRWQAYKTQYPFKLKFDGSAKVETLWLRTFNGEQEFIDFSKNSPERVSRAAVRHADVTWTDPDGDRYIAKIRHRTY